MEEEEVKIREASADDLHNIGELAHAIWPETYGHIISKDQIDYMLDMIYSHESLTRQIQDHDHTFLIAEIGDEPVGYASYSETRADGVYKLHKLYVLPGIQGRGLGQILLESVIEEISPFSPSSLMLNVNRHNKAVKFYEKLGFEIVGEEDLDIGNGYFMNDYIMEKRL